MVVYVDEFGTSHPASFALKRKRRAWPFVLLVVVLAVAGLACYAWWHEQLGREAGSMLMEQVDMGSDALSGQSSDEVESSRITVSVRQTPELSQDGKLHVNFVVMEPNNGLSERLEIEQDGQVVYRSSVVAPGYMIEWGSAPKARVGEATATVYAVDQNGNDRGNAVSMQLSIVEEGQVGQPDTQAAA